MLLKKDLSQCKDLRTVEHLAQQFGWYAAAWTPQEPHLICSDEQFTEFAKALGKLAVTQDGENLLYFLALAAETAQERKNRTDRILERKLFYETSTVITEADIARCHNDQLATPPGVRKADAMETLHFLAPPEEEKQDDTAPNGIVSISAKDLQDKEFKPIKWVVEGLLPQGLALLVAPPKYGKSWLMLDLCLSVASGQKFLDMPTNKTDCLYLALEDNQRRLQDRKEYENSALVQTIRKLVERNHGSWSGTAKEILEAGKLLTRRFIAESPKDVGVRVKKLENEMREFDGIVYERVKRGTSGALHYFCKENMQVQNEVQLDLSKQVA